MNTNKNILVITYWDFNDALIQTYTLPYLEIIAKYIPDKSYIYLVCLNKKIQKIKWKHPKIKVISLKYIPFGVTVAILWAIYLVYLYVIIFFRKIDRIHTWCTPAGMFGYILSKLTGKRLILDSYEPHAETMVECGEWKPSSLAYKVLFFYEKKMTHHAQYLIATTEGMVKEYAVSRYQFSPDKNNWFVKPACVDLQKFNFQGQTGTLRRTLNLSNQQIIGVYIGKFGGIYLEEEFFEIVTVAHRYWKEKFRLLLLSNISDEKLEKFLHEYNIPETIIMKRFIPHEEVAQYLSIAGFGITPVKPVYTKKFSSPIKNGEYWAMGLPVLITKNISEDSEIIEKHGVGAVIEELSSTAYLKAIEKIDELLRQDKRVLRQRIRQIAIQYRNFSIAESIYKKIYSETD